MGTLERPFDRGTRLGRAALLRTGTELREARVGRGLSLKFAAGAVGISDSELSRIEHGRSPMVPYLTLARCAAVVGLDLACRAYPGGRPVRDAPQLGLLAGLRAELAPALRWATEVPLPLPGDQRAWDAVITGDGWSIPVEAETMPTDIQATTRRLRLKLRDSRMDAVLLVVRDSRSNRARLRESAPDLQDLFPVRATTAMAALRAGSRPPGSAVILLPWGGTERRDQGAGIRRGPGPVASASRARRFVPTGGMDRLETGSDSGFRQEPGPRPPPEVATDGRPRRSVPRGGTWPTGSEAADKRAAGDQPCVGGMERPGPASRPGPRAASEPPSRTTPGSP